jgi:hypothetical protein
LKRLLLKRRRISWEHSASKWESKESQGVDGSSQAEKKVANFWPMPATPKTGLFTIMDYVNNQLYLLLLPIMGRNKPYKRQTHHFTPPPAL